MSNVPGTSAGDDEVDVKPDLSGKMFCMFFVNTKN